MNEEEMLHRLFELKKKHQALYDERSKVYSEIMVIEKQLSKIYGEKEKPQTAEVPSNTPE